MGNDINTKMGVTGIAQYKQAMSQASQSVKTLDAALKLNEKQLQATGDKEVYMQQKSKLLQQQIAAQTNVVKQGQAALTAMEKQGVNPASAAYQKMSQQVLNAQTALLGMNQDLDSVGQSAEETAQKTDKLTDSLNGINKKVSFDAVLNGIGKITDGMEAAARKVAQLAGNIWDEMLTAAAWADDLSTRAEMFGIDEVKLQKMERVSQTIQTPVNAIFTAKQKIEKNLHDMSDTAMEAFETLGLVVTGKFGEKALNMSELQPGETGFDYIFTLGDRLKSVNDEILRDVLAQNLMGQSWREMLPLINAGKDAYLEALEAQDVVSQENVDNLNKLASQVKAMESEWDVFKKTIEGELAGAFSVLAESITDVLTAFNEYLATPEGQEKLASMAESLTNIFSEISDVDVAQAVETLGGALNTVTDALDWINRNGETVAGVIKGIGGAFVGLELAKVLVGLSQGVTALKNLLGGSGSAGTSGAGGFWAWLTKAATNVLGTDIPGWLYGLSVATLWKTGQEVNEQIPLGLYGDLLKKQQMQEMIVAGYVDPLTGEIYNMEKTGEPKRKKNITGTATEDQLQGYVIERTVEDIYDDLYQAINDYDPATNARDTTQFFDNVLYPLIQEAGKSSGVVGDSIDEIADLIYDKWIQSLFDDEWEGTTGGLLNILQEAIDENAKGLTVETIPVLPDDAAAMLEDQLGPITVDVIPNVKSMSFANGLPYVPFDGYVATLHKGERVVPANQNKNYNFTNNNYFDHTQMNNGTDVNGVAAAIAEHNRRTLAGFGG